MSFRAPTQTEFALPNPAHWRMVAAPRWSPATASAKLLQRNLHPEWGLVKGHQRPGVWLLCLLELATECAVEGGSHDGVEVPLHKCRVAMGPLRPGKELCYLAT